MRLLAISMFQFFNGLYIYEVLTGMGLGSARSLSITALFFSLLFLSQAIIIPFAVWLIAKRGLRFVVFWGTMFLVGFYLILYFSRFDPIFLFVAAIFGGVQIGLYWTAYHIYFTELTDDRNQGQEVSVGGILSAVVLIAGPVFGGLMITYGGFGAVFLAMIVLLIISVLPLRFLPNQKNKVEVDIKSIVTSLNPKKEFRTYLALMGIGSSEVMYVIFWPIYIFPILSGFAGVGFMASLGAFVTSCTAFLIGFLVDKFGAGKVLKIVSPIDSIFWVAKCFVTLPNQVYTLSSVRGATASAQGMSFDSLVYERARHKGLVAVIVERELGLGLGRFVLLFALGMAFWFGFPLVGILILAAIVTLLPSLYPETKNLR